MTAKFRMAIGAFLAALLAACAGPTGAEPLQDRLDQAAAHGGGTVMLERGVRVFVRDGVIVPEQVTLDLNGGELVADLHSADAAGARLMSHAAILNGAITVRSHGTPGTQAGAHAPILVGGLLGDAAIAPSRITNPRGWRISNVTLRSDKSLMLSEDVRLGAAAVQVIGGAHEGLIEEVRIPDSDRLAGGIMLDWGAVGDIRSDDVVGNARRHANGQAYTTHPHSIVIRNISIGKLTRKNRASEGTFGVRLSGVHDVTVSHISIEMTTGAAIAHTAGDLGYEFAKPDDRRRAHRGILIEDVTIAGIDGGYAILSDSYADNVGRAAAAGYRPMLAPIAPTDLVVRRVRGEGSGRGDGLRIDHQLGGRFEELVLAGFRTGIIIDEQVHAAAVVNPLLLDSTQAAVAIGHPHRPPTDIALIAPRVRGTGRAELIRIDRSERVRVTNSIVPVTVDHTAIDAAVLR